MSEDRSKKISELTENTGPGANDLVLIVSAPGSNSAQTMVARVSTLLGNTANVSVATVGVLKFSNTTTPANSTITVSKGTMWVDDTYLYVATANNTLKRVALSAF